MTKSPTATEPTSPAPRLRRAPHSPDARIHLTGKLPRRKNPRTMRRFELYRDKMTVKEFLDAGGLRQDLFYDAWAKFIEVKEPPKHHHD